MRKFLIAGPLLCLLVLPGCITVGDDGRIVIATPATSPVSSGDPVVNDARAWTERICGAVPTVGTVLSILATFTGGGAVVDIGRQIGAGICSALNAKGVRRGMRAPKYRGVAIHLERR